MGRIWVLRTGCTPLVACPGKNSTSLEIPAPASGVHTLELVGDLFVDGVPIVLRTSLAERRGNYLAENKGLSSLSYMSEFEDDCLL